MVRNVFNRANWTIDIWLLSFSTYLWRLIGFGVILDVLISAWLFVDIKLNWRGIKLHDWGCSHNCGKTSSWLRCDTAVFLNSYGLYYLNILLLCHFLSGVISHKVFAVKCMYYLLTWSRIHIRLRTHALRRWTLLSGRLFQGWIPIQFIWFLQNLLFGLLRKNGKLLYGILSPLGESTTLFLRCTIKWFSNSPL